VAKPKREPWSMRLNKTLWPVFGPAQLGAGRPETPYAPPANPVCPICNQPMADHRVERTPDQSHATRIYCPPAPAS
jgi:hypothetical protein